MGKYKTTRACIHAVNSAKDAQSLRAVLEKFYPDAFIKWDHPVCVIGDILSRKVDRRTLKYKVIKSHDNKSALLYLGTNTLWKNFSTQSVTKFNTISAKAFSEMTNGMTIDNFKLVKK